jgi:hypothetical protein
LVELPEVVSKAKTIVVISVASILEEELGALKSSKLMLYSFKFVPKGIVYLNC